MTRRAATRARQRGAALLVIAALLILGVAWGAFAAINRGNSLSAQEREVLTGQALAAAKQALLAYAAQYAARTDHDKPGRMPCPEALTSIGTATEGDENAAGCSNTMANLGRLPWRTLGIDRLADGSGEPLWYALSPGFRGVSPTTVINFDTPGQLTYDGTANAAVAVIIAPGRPLNTLADAAALPGWCPAKVNQYAAGRTTAPIDPANFLECGNATGSYRNPGSSQWSNDRAIIITAAEWATAIAGAVNDRIQRQVAPALADWRATESNNNWGDRFLPAAATFSNPATNGLCGTYGVREGLMPVARSTSAACTGWTGGTVSSLPLLGAVGATSCAQVGSSYQCQYTQGLGLLGLGAARIRARAPSAGLSFRGPLSAGNIDVDPAMGNVTNFSLTLDPTTGEALIDFRVSFLIALFTPVTVTIPNLPDAALFADSRMAWFVNNDWARHTYYSIAPGSRLNAPSGCTFAGDTDCMILNGLPVGTGNANDKRFVLALMGPGALATQSRPSNDFDDYIESRTDSTTYHQDRIDAAFNDRVATCPFKYQDHAGADVVICN